MDSVTADTADVVLFAFRDATCAGRVVSAARARTGVRSVAVVACAEDCQVRILADTGAELGDARWLASALAVLDVVSGPMAALTGSPRETYAVSLPDSEEGFATFGRLVPRGGLVLMVAVCDESAPGIGSLRTPLGTALCRMPADCMIRMSTRPRDATAPAAPRSLGAVARCTHGR
jgi:hypothetical protein